MKILGSYKNGNFRTAIFEDGTKIRETNDDEFQAAFAENMDIKIQTIVIWVVYSVMKEVQQMASSVIL